MGTVWCSSHRRLFLCTLLCSGCFGVRDVVGEGFKVLRKVPGSYLHKPPGFDLGPEVIPHHVRLGAVVFHPTGTPCIPFGHLCLDAVVGGEVEHLRDDPDKADALRRPDGSTAIRCLDESHILQGKDGTADLSLCQGQVLGPVLVGKLYPPIPPASVRIRCHGAPDTELPHIWFGQVLRVLGAVVVQDGEVVLCPVVETGQDERFRCPFAETEVQVHVDGCIVLRPIGRAGQVVDVWELALVRLICSDHWVPPKKKGQGRFPVRCGLLSDSGRKRPWATDHQVTRHLTFVQA